MRNKITAFGEEVKEALKRKEMTQGDLAEKLGITKQYLYLILFGMKPGKKHLPMIAEICEINTDPDTTDTADTGEINEACGESKKPVKETGGDIREISEKGAR